MTLTLIIILIIAGLILLVLEVLVIPGSTIVGVLGFISMVVAIWQAYATHDSLTGHIILFSTILATIITLYFVLKARTWNRLMLKSELDGRVNVIRDEILQVGDEGITVSRLNPVGKVMFKGEYYEVYTQSEFIDQQTAVIITKVDSTRIYVKRKEE